MAGSSLTRYAAAVAMFVVCFPAVALADACHVAPPPLEALGLGFHVATSFELATYDNDRGSGSYVGIALAAAYRREWLRVRTQLPAYRLRRNRDVFHGPGDLVLAADAAILRANDDNGATGLGLAIGVPTGDESSDLGMGHVMLMPGIWAELTRDRAFSQVQVVYGRALGSQEDHTADEHAGHHGHTQVEHATGPGPIVNPMNMSEITGRLSAGYRLTDVLRVRAGVDAAVPVADDEGESRAIAVLGVDLLPDPFNTAIEGQLPFVGDAFTAKALFSAGLRF